MWIKFDIAVNLSNNPEDSGSPKVAVSQEDVYVVWDDRTGSVLDRDVFFIRRYEWGNNKRIYNNNHTRC